LASAEATLALVADDLAGGEVDDIFGDAGHEVADAFEFATHASVEEASAEVFITLLHDVLDFIKDAAVQFIDDVIFDDDLAGGLGIFIQDGAEELVADDGDALAEFDDGGGEGRRIDAGGIVVVDLGDDLGDAGGMVGDAFDIGVDFEDEGQDAEVFGEGVEEGHDFIALFFDRDFFEIDAVISAADRASGIDVVAGQGFDGFFEHVDGHAGLADQAAAERGKAPLDGEGHMGRG
jgi:hypothetical protein